MKRVFAATIPMLMLAACGGGSSAPPVTAPTAQSTPQEAPQEAPPAVQEPLAQPDTSFSSLTGPVTLKASAVVESGASASLFVTVPDDRVKVTAAPAGNGLERFDFDVGIGDVRFDQKFDAAKDAIGTIPLADRFRVLEKPDGTILILQDPADAAARLDYTRFGSWIDGGTDTRPGSIGMFAAGFETPVADVPTSGTAIYAGSTFGFLATDSGFFALGGRATLDADFGKQTITGRFDQMKAVDLDGSVPDQRWNDFTATAAIKGNSFTGSTASVTSSALSPAPLQGDIAGAFHGPKADEVGGAWTLFGGTSFASGSFGAKQ